MPPRGKWAYGPPVILGAAPWQKKSQDRPWRQQAQGQHERGRPPRSYLVCPEAGCGGWSWADLGCSTCMRCGASYDIGNNGQKSCDAIDPGAFQSSVAGPIEDTLLKIIDGGQVKIVGARVKDPFAETQTELNTAAAATAKAEMQLNHQRTLLHQARERVVNF